MSSFGRSVRRGLAAGACAALAALGAASAAHAGEFGAKTVRMSGTAYTFNSPDPIVGATIRIAELPDLVATTNPDGSYAIEIPDGTKVTPFIEAAGHYPIHLQTFVTAGRDIERANFQTPNQSTYNALATLLGVEVDDHGRLANCAIVSTFSTEAVRDLGFTEFWAVGAHGVAGATASTEPSLPGPIYFNENVIPDRTQTESSEDGGVLWEEVPAGVYRVTAQHPSARFADLNATCRPGRVVNANPPQGLFQLRRGEKLDTRVSAMVKKVKVKRRVVRVKVAADEHVSVAASITRRGKELAATGRSDGVGAYAPGARKLKLKLPRKPKRERVKLTTTFADPSGNGRTVSDKLRLPKPKRRK